MPNGTMATALRPADSIQQAVRQQGQWLQVQTAGGIIGYSAAWYLALPGAEKLTQPK